MHVVQVLPELNEGGVERGTVELSRELVARGLSSTVVSNGGRLAATLEKEGGRHCRLDVCSKNPFSAAGRIYQLKRLLDELRPDILHARSRVPAWMCHLANRQGIPFVTTVHGFNSVNAYSRVMTFGDKVICVSGAIKDYVQKYYRVPEHKLVVIPRGIDLDTFSSEHLDHDFMTSFSKEYGLCGRYVISSVGRVTQLKDYETLIRAIAALSGQGIDAVGLIVGGVRDDKQNYFSSLQHLVKELQLDDRIIFAGNQQRVAEIYALSDVVVSASKKPESFGRAAAEALAMEVPVIATAHGGVLDIVKEARTGFLFPPGDSAALVRQLITVRSAGLTGLREFVAGNFTLESMCTRTLEVYRALAEHPVPATGKEPTK